MQHRTRWAAIAVVGGVLLASGCDSSPNGPNEPPASDLPIAYACLCSEGPGLYRANFDGTGVVLVTTLNSTFAPWSYTWSPDGTKFAYNGPEEPINDAPTQIYVSNADGTGKHAITNFEGGAWQPAWSPDGSKILFVRASDHGIYVMNVDGSGVQSLTPGDGSASYGGPSWSPDGSMIAFYKEIPEADSTSTRLYVMNSDGSNPRALTTGMSWIRFFTRPAWSPQGDRIAFEVHHGGGFGDRFIATIKPDGSQLTHLTTPTDYPGFPSWSPDGQWLIFENTVMGGEGSRLYIINRDGTGKKRVTTSPTWEGNPTWVPTP